MSDLVKDIHRPVILDYGFVPVPSPAGFGPLWCSYEVPSGSGGGSYHICSPTGIWSIAIHDFTLENDAFLEFNLPEYLSITWYESISGEEFEPYRRLRAKSITGFYSGPSGWRALIHGRVPIKCIGIEVTPEFSRRYLESEYGNEFESVRDAFLSVDSEVEFPEMRALLSHLWPDPRDKERSMLFYEGKVLEAMGLLVERTRHMPKESKRSLNSTDTERIRMTMAYIDDHCSLPLRIDELSRIACMSGTKFKESFRQVASASVTQYIQRRRMGLAEQLLRQQDLSIAQVAKAVGYSCASRFSELFRRETGMSPSEYREVLKRD